ncbi:MAG: GFA family protein [Hyphomicrobiales bacterium]|nr:GFA family protein [Hyphomicrobiales bacterium]
MSEPITGGCQCGAVRFEATAEPLFGGHCQCVNCRKFSGAGHASNLLVPADSFTVTGEVSLYEYTADSGAHMTRAFCPKCGSPVYGFGSGRPGGIMLRAGTLDDPSRFTPQMVLFTASAAPWDHIGEDLPSFPGMPTKK